MAYQGSITLVDLSDGSSGSSGINTAIVYLYQRAINTPSGPNGTLTYNFSTHSLNGSTAAFNGWESSIGNLSGDNPIWIIAATATASADAENDSILTNEWSNPIKMAQDGQDGQQGPPGQDGTPGTPGQDGAPGLNGINTATVYIYKRTASTPDTPDDVTYTFADGSFIPPSGWDKQVPTTNGNPCYVSSAIAIGNGATATLEWSTPAILAEDGINPTVESISNGVRIIDAEGNITYIYNGTNGTSYYTHVRYSANANGYNYTSTPDSSTIYIGVYSGTSNEAPAYNNPGWTWSRYVGNTGASGVSVTDIKEVYYITTGSAPAQSTLPNGTPINSISTDANEWTTVVPTYVTGGTYYTSLQTSLSSGTSPVFSTIVANQGLTSANSNAASALSQAQAANSATTLLGGHFIYRANGTESTPASANVVQTVEVEGIDVSNNPGLWGYNVHIGSSGIRLRNNEITLSEWTSTALNFYNPSTHNIDATLNVNGLKISKGGITAGTSNNNQFIYISTEDYPLRQFQLTQDIALDPEKTYYIINENNRYTEVEEPDIADINTYYEIEVPGVTINGYTPMQGGIPALNDPAWREIIGTNFGIDSTGALYANNAKITGAINANSGYFKNIQIKNSNDATVAQLVNNQLTFYYNSSGTTVQKAAEITSTGLDIYSDGSTKVASFGTTAQIGNTSGTYMYIDASGLQVKNSTTTLATFSIENISLHGTMTTPWATIKSSKNLAFYIGGRTTSHAYGPSLHIEEYISSNSSNLHFVRFNGMSFISYPVMIATSTSNNISLTSNTITKIPVQVSAFNGIDTYDPVFTISNGNVYQDKFDGSIIRVSGSVYVSPSAQAIVNVFIYRFNANDGSTSPVEVARGDALISTSGGVVQVTPRLIVKDDGYGDYVSDSSDLGDYYYLAVRIMGASGSVVCRHRDTQLCIEMLS